MRDTGDELGSFPQCSREGGREGGSGYYSSYHTSYLLAVDRIYGILSCVHVTVYDG